MKRVLSQARPLLDGVLRAVALVVTDRRWAAPLSAMALGFGLFLGVAIGPGAAGGLATGPGQVIAVAAPEEAEPAGGEDREGEAEAGFAEPEAEESFEPEAETFAPVAELAPEAPLPEPPAEPQARGEEPPPAGEEAEEPSEAQLLEGTVVHVNPAAGSYTMAIAGGELVSVHAAKLPAAGAKVSAEAEPLDNSTFAELSREAGGSAARASFRGVVTHRDPDPADPAYTVSGRGSSILVQAPVAEAAELPEVGAYAEVTVRIEKEPKAGASAADLVAAPGAEPAPAPSPQYDPVVPADPVAAPADPAEPAVASPPAASPECAPDPKLKPPPAPRHRLSQVKLKAEPEPATYVDLAGILTAVCAAEGQLLLSADDLRAGEADLAIAVPKKFKTAKLGVGDSLLATAEVGEDGTLTLAGLASDEGLAGAEDAATAQGDLAR